MKWYEVKERSAGEKRLILTYYIYKLFGRYPVVLIAFFVALITFLKSKDLRFYSKKYLEIAGIKPSHFNIFRHFLSYAISQVDKIEVFCGTYNKGNICMADIDNSFSDCEKQNKGCICIFSHVGNIDIARTLMDENRKISIILSLEQAKIFRNFLNNFSIFKNVTVFAVEEMGADTVLLLKQRADDGEMIFIAGDRNSKNSRNTEVKVLGRKAEFPLGTFKLAELLEIPVFFISAIKIKRNCKIIVKEFKTFEKCAKKMAESFADFVSEEALSAPFQFYHFYDFFID